MVPRQISLSGLREDLSDSLASYTRRDSYVILSVGLKNNVGW
jgi:hypothetical protein